MFKLPSLPNPEINQKAILLHKMVWGILAIFSFTFIVGIATHFKYTERYLFGLLCTWAISLVTFRLIKTGHIKVGTTIYVSLLIALIFGLSLTGGGIRAHVIRFLPMFVLFVGLTFGRKQIWTLAIISILVSLLLVWIELMGLLPRTEAVGTHPMIYWFCSTQAILLICFIEHLSVSRFNKAFDELKTENKLRLEHEEKYIRIFSSFQDIYFQTDLEGNVIMITPSVKKKLGYEPKEVAGKPLSNHYHLQQSKATLRALLIEKGELTDYEIDLVTKFGDIVNMTVSCQLIYNEKKEVIGLEGTFFDITHRKKAEQILMLQNQQLQDIANLQSHMVRRPVANVIGLINLLDIENINNPENKVVLEKLAQSSKELDELIHHIVKKTNDISSDSEQ